MNAPKMLPWLASTAGIELERVEQLWQSASDYAANITGETGSTRHLSITREQMIALVEKEIPAANPVEEAPWLMIQANFSVAPMIVADAFAQATAVTRQTLGRWTEKNRTAA